MKITALICLVAGVLIALFTYIAIAADFVDVKVFFKLGFMALGLMVISAGYFLISFLLEWAKEMELFKGI